MHVSLGAEVARPYPTVITLQRKEEGERSRARQQQSVSKETGEAGSVTMDTWWLWCSSMLLGVTASSGWFGPSLKPVK